jgi:HK97 family phage major capsid protein
MTLKEMNDKVAKACDDIQAIAARVKAANRDYTDDEAKQIDSIQAQMDLDIVQLKALRAEENALAKVAGLVGAKAVMEKMRQAGIGGDSTKSKEIFSHNGVKAHFLSASDKVAALGEGQRVANGTGEMIRAMICGVGPRTPHEVKTEMTKGNNNLGGYLVPNYLSGDLIDLMRAKSVLGAAGCPTIVLEGHENSFAKVVGDATVQTKGELAEFTPTDIRLGMVSMIAHTVGVLITASREQAEDCTNFVQLVEDLLAKTVATKVDYYGINGFSSTSLGLMGSTDINATTGIGAIAWGDISAAVTRLRVKNQEPNGSILYPTIHDALMNTSTGDGVNSSLGWLEPPPSIRDKKYWNTTNCSSSKVIVGDFTKYAMGLRTGLQIEATTTGGDMFKKHGVQIKATIRCDFVALDSDAFERLEDVTV